MSPKTARRKVPSPRTRQISAAEFKATCLALMDEVQTKRTAITITKHRKPVARLIPILPAETVPFVGRCPGLIESRGDLVAPVAPDWEVDADL